jgi:hypothetical protein
MSDHGPPGWGSSGPSGPSWVGRHPIWACLLLGIGSLVIVGSFVVTVIIAVHASSSSAAAAGSTGTGDSGDDSGTATDDPPTEGPPRTDADEVFEFGDTVEFDDDTTLRVDGPYSFTPRGTAVGGEKQKFHAKFRVTLTNRAGEASYPSSTTATVRSGDRVGDQVFQPTTMAPEGSLQSGSTARWWMGFGIDSPRNVSLVVSLGSDYDDVTFTTSSSPSGPLSGGVAEPAKPAAPGAPAAPALPVIMRVVAPRHPLPVRQRA